MTTIYPDAEWRPLADEQPTEMPHPPDLIILHTMAGFDLDRCDAYFRVGGYGGVESHFGVGFDGEVYQWVDLECRADANYQANENAISIETADTGEGFPSWTGSNVPAWTDAQVDAIARIVAWCCDRFDIPCDPAPDSRPGNRGIAWHRQGVESVPPYQRGYRVPGGELWSTSKGKVCPGDRRVAQIPTVIQKARQILAGGDEEDDMPYSQAQLEAFALNGAKRAIMSLLGDWPTNGTDREDIEGVRAVVTPLSSPILGPLAPSPSQGVLFTITDSEHPDRQYTVIAGQRLWLSPGEKSAMGLDGVTVMGLVAAHPLAQLPEMVRA